MLNSINPKMAPYINKAKALNLAYDRQWLLLTHYDKTRFGSYEGQADGMIFYNDKINGPTDPEAELIATLNNFVAKVDSKKPDYHALCQFPARKTYLVNKLKIPTSILPKVGCKVYKAFRKKISPKSVSAVFSSYYLGNPSSTFGHTFLLFSKNIPDKNGDNVNELLDIGLSYAADPPGNVNPLFYVVGGLAGAFPGRYSHHPYYFKVREYNDFESRDLWTYHLDLSQAEINLLLDHLWELGPTYFNYKFFTENCAYHVLATLEAAAPRLRLLDKLPFWVIPSDTILALFTNKGLVKNIGLRASARRRFFYKMERLSHKEKSNLLKLIDKNDPKILDPKLTELERARVLENYSEFLEYKHGKELHKGDGKAITWKFAALRERAKLKVKTKEVKIRSSSIDLVHKAHPSARFGISLGHHETDGGTLEIDQRFALHDLLDYGQGYPKNAQIEFFHITGRYSEKESWDLDRWSFANVSNFNPINEFEYPSSWQIDFGIRTDRSNLCDTCLSLYTQYAKGMTFGMDQNDRYVFYGLAKLDLSYSHKFQGIDTKLGIGPKFGFIFNFSMKQKLLIDSEYLFYIEREGLDFLNIGAEYRYSFNNQYSIGASLYSKDEDTESKIKFYKSY